MNSLPNDREFVVLMINANRDDGYVSADVLGKAYDKPFKDYSRLKDTKRVWKAIAERVGADMLQLVIKPGRGKKGEVLLHPLVAIHFAQWLDPAFAVFLLDLFMDYVKAAPELTKDLINRTDDVAALNDIAETLIQRLLYLVEYHPLMKAIQPLEGTNDTTYINLNKLNTKTITQKTPAQIKLEFGVNNARDVLTAKQLAAMRTLQELEQTALEFHQVTTSKEAYAVCKQVAQNFGAMLHPTH